ncbi:techylectin-5A-like [Dermacentor albipictus]|uniref:techylectin-5A-like n=1 Tax=Dermacentor albipictus TaxID=60249 RepID=UPI0031FC0DB4
MTAGNLRRRLTMLVGVAILYVVAMAAGAAALAVTDVRPSIEQAEQRARELTEILASLKTTILPRHCTDLLGAGQRSSGVYTVFHKGAGPSGQSVYCDMDTDGGGWTVIQRRGQFGNRAYHFYRNWTEYARGFGDPSEEYWIGNDALNALTSSDQTMVLRVVLSNSTDDSASVDYDSVRVEPERNLYRIHLGKFAGPEGWDSMAISNGQNFSTYDRDNDLWPQNCASTFRGAWWYNSCHSANLNGLNLNGPHESFADGIEWSLRGSSVPLHYHSYPSVKMMIRPVEMPRFLLRE